MLARLGLESLDYKKLSVLLLTLIGVFFVVFSPHWSYPFPLHIDEWHHIDQSIRLGSYGEYFEMLRAEWERRFSGMEIGFHFFLLVLSFAVEVVLVYQFLPAIWATLGALVLWYVVYQKTNRRFWVAWLAVIFFASIKSNVNLTGLWFFTPLSFAIPFIFLYIYLFSEGLARHNKKMLFGSFIIMLGLVPTHSISLLFAIPALLLYGILYICYILREYKFFALFLFIPLFGFLFYKDTLQYSWAEALENFFIQLQFPYGWGVLERENSFLEVYPLIGYLFAAAGAFFIVWRGELRRYLLYLLWPLSVFVLIILFRMYGFSFFSPFQRNMYYLALGLPLLSALGAAHLFGYLMKLIKSLFSSVSDVLYASRALAFGLIILVAIFAFTHYDDVPKGLELYHPISQADYEAFKFLSTQRSGHILATPFVSSAAYAISGMRPLATVFFDSDFRSITEEFFFFADCDSRNELLAGVTDRLYIVSEVQFECGWDLLYDRGDFIYQLN